MWIDQGNAKILIMTVCARGSSGHFREQGIEGSYRVYFDVK